jgi:GntR family transcriptional regulator, transcriptional repressor for pyruvate dehydrogenase complex
MEYGAGGPAIRAATDTLRKEILQTAAPGAFLGSEADLQHRLGLSRPTLRQAARILENEGLLLVRRGKNGGMFARLPSSEAVVRVVSVVLYSQGATIDDLARVNALVLAEAARMAATEAAEDCRAGLLAFVDERFAEARPSARHTLETVLGVNRRIADMSRSPTLALFASVLAELAQADFGVNMLSNSARRRSMREYVRALAEAVRDGDGERAAQLVQQNYERESAWLTKEPVRLR